MLNVDPRDELVLTLVMPRVVAGELCSVIVLAAVKQARRKIGIALAAELPRRARESRSGFVEFSILNGSRKH